MADTSIQHIAEAWVTRVGLPKHFPGLMFSGAKRKLIWGGAFAFDAVSGDGRVVVCISTSSARTASGNLATAKIQKLKTDALYLLHIEGKTKKVMAFTERSMFENFQRAVTAGRFSPDIELLHIALPKKLNAKVLASREVASREVSPVSGGR